MASFPAKKNTAFTFYVSLVSQANTKIMQASPTLAAGDVQVAIDDGAPANLATLPVVDADFTKRVKVAMSAAEMNGDRITVIFSDVAGAQWCDLTLDIPTSVRQVDDLASSAALVTVQTDTDDIQTRLPAALIGGRMDSSMQAVATGAITATAFAAGAIDAAAIAADAIGASEFAQGAADKVFGTGGAGLTELAQAIPSATPRPDQAFMLLYMAARNLLQVTATEKRVTNDAGTVIAKKALTDDGTTYAEAEMVSGP